MSDTPGLELPEWGAAQAQPWFNHNVSLRMIEAAVRAMVLDRDLTAPPVSCDDGATYLIDTPATGDWAGHDGYMAVAAGEDAANGWLFVPVEIEGFRLWVDDENVRIQYTSDGSPVGWVEVADGSPVDTSGRLIGIQRVTASGAGTYNATPGTGKVLVRQWGAGGGGAGVGVAGAANVSIGWSGSPGAFLEKLLTADFDGGAYVVGAKGTGGAIGLNSGNDGGDTTFTDTNGSPTVYTADGGLGGNNRTTAAPPFVTGIMTGATATNGDFNLNGGASDVGIALSTAYAASGRGGNAPILSSGGRPARSAAVATAVTGLASPVCGGGSGGVSTTTSATGAAGGDGGDGMIEFWEYSA